MSIAFFISNTGNLIHVPDNHIGVIIRNPERFGLTPAEVESVYRRYGERVGVEGKARREILLKIIADGWIRIRRYRTHWSVTVEGLTPAVQELLRDWAAKMLSGRNSFKEVDRYMLVKVSTAEGEAICTIGDLADGSYQMHQVSENDRIYPD